MIPCFPTITYASTQLMHRYQQKGKSLQEFNFEFSELFLAVANCEPKDKTYPLKIYMYTQIYLIQQLAGNAHPTLQKVTDYAQNIKI